MHYQRIIVVPFRDIALLGRQNAYLPLLLIILIALISRQTLQINKIANKKSRVILKCLKIFLVIPIPLHWFVSDQDYFDLIIENGFSLAIWNFNWRMINDDSKVPDRTFTPFVPKSLRVAGEAEVFALVAVIRLKLFSTTSLWFWHQLFVITWLQCLDVGWCGDLTFLASFLKKQLAKNWPSMAYMSFLLSLTIASSFLSKDLRIAGRILFVFFFRNANVSSTVGW